MNAPHRHKLYVAPVGLGAATPPCPPAQLTATKDMPCCEECAKTGKRCGDPQGVGAGDTNVSVTPATSPWMYFAGGIAAAVVGGYVYKNRRKLAR